MPSSTPPAFLPTVVTRLRAAGCVFAEDEARLLVSEARTPAELTSMVDRRSAGLPLEHVVGWAEFCGLRVAVDPGVFVPRRRTEFLVSRAAAHAGTGPHVVVDLCCGSGAVALALAPALDPAELHAADIDPAAVACARRNLAAAGGQVHQGDLYGALPATLRGRVTVLAANVPYVPTGEVGLLPPEARLHESPIALDGGGDGLDVLRRVSAGAPAWLAPGGGVLAEASERQASRALEIFAGDGLVPSLQANTEMDVCVVAGTMPASRQGGPAGAHPASGPLVPRQSSGPGKPL